MNLEKKVHVGPGIPHPAETENIFAGEEESREYLVRVYTGKVKNPIVTHVNRAVWHLVEALLRDASKQITHRRNDYNHALVICKHFGYPVFERTFEDKQFYSYWEKNKDDFSETLIRKIIPNALQISERV